MAYIDPNSPEFKLGVKLGWMLRTFTLYAGIGALGYLFGKNINKGKGFNKFYTNGRSSNDWPFWILVSNINPSSLKIIHCI